MTPRPYTRHDLTRIYRLRQYFHPSEIAEIMNRSPGAIAVLLTRARANGMVFPKLKHARCKYDMAMAGVVRAWVRGGLTYEAIHTQHGIAPAVISRLLAAELRGELFW